MEPARQHHNVTLGILTLAGIAFSLQQTMVFPALPTFQEEFDTSTAWATWVLTGFLVSAAVTTPILGRLGDQYGKGRMLIVSLGTLPRRLHRRRGGVEHRVADRLPDPLRRRRRALPAQLRDHPGRVPARAGEGGDRPALGRVRSRRRPRNRPLGPHRRPRLLALALHPRLDPGGGVAPARPSLRARVARALALARGYPGSAAARRGLDLADARAHRGRELGLGVAGDPDARGGSGHLLRALGGRRAALALADGGHADAHASTRAADEHGDDGLRLRALQLLRARPDVRPDS